MSIPFNMSPKSGEHQYLAFLEYVYNEGKDIVNDRTGEICRTATGGTLHYDCRRNGFPMVTTRKAYYRKAINEMCGYFQGFNNAAQFRQLGTDTWDANGNGTPAWLANRHRKGTDDLGHVYGYVARNWPTFDGQVMDLVKDVLAKVMKHEDDRGLTITFWNPGVFSRAALRPCLRQHTFTIIDGMLHLTSEQRSTDMALGMVFNMMQCAWLLMTVAHLAGLKPGIATHNIINAHIEELSSIFTSFFFVGFASFKICQFPCSSN